MSRYPQASTHDREIDPLRLERVVTIIVDACRTSDDAFEIADEVGRRVGAAAVAAGPRSRGPRSGSA